MTLFAAKEILRRIAQRDWHGIRARLGRTKPERPGPHLWMHTASNGEAMSARPVIDRLAARGEAILLTVNTDTALALVRGWNVPGLSVRLAPVDLPGPVRRVIARWGVTAHVTFESDLWPIRIRSVPGPVIVLGARLTARTAKGWTRLGRLARDMLGRVSYLSAQDAQSLERFSALGLKSAARGPVFDLKALYTPPDATPGADLRAAFTRHETWLAASTHQGEEDIVIAAHERTLRARPGLRLILAPRHPKRAAGIEQLIGKAGLSCARRSRGEDPAGAQVYLADTLGEMPLWYALAGVTLVAGSLTDRGGHTPYEPAAFGSAILSGPDTGNFRAAYARLKDAGAMIDVTGAGDLGDALVSLADASAQEALGRAAQEALRQDTDFDALMRDVQAVLNA
nr:glycosyltransferase N-terminal domain-containing protein [Marivita sp. GX14005]